MAGEFEFINHIKSRYKLDKVGDDCAVLPKDGDHDLLLTADILVEDIDFRLSWTSPEFLGHRSLAVSLSDIAAMLGEPIWAMLSIAVPENLWSSGFLDRFYEGWFGLADRFGVELVGGDVSRSPDKLVIDSIVGGQAPRGRAALRSNARPGDSIYVSGTVGAASGGLKLLETRDENMGDKYNELVLRQLKPMPHLLLANSLQEYGIVSACIDVSDGLSSDLRHICEASGVGADIDLENLPIDPGLAGHFPLVETQEMALNGGEDYGLLFTSAEINTNLLDGHHVTKIGRITDSKHRIRLFVNGKPQELSPKGYTHF